MCGFATRRPAFVTPLPHPFVLPLHINWYAKAVGDDEVLNDLRVGNDDEELVAEPHGVKRAELLGPFV